MFDRSQRPFRGLRSPGLPPELRSRVLGAAASAAIVAPPVAGWVDRLWESRLGRWGLALALSGLFAGHLGVSPLAAPQTPAELGVASSWAMEMSVMRALDELPSLVRLLEGGGDAPR